MSISDQGIANAIIRIQGITQLDRIRETAVPTQATPSTKGPSKGERTASRILQSASSIFADQGYEKASLKKIADAADVREPSIYQHFGSKENLYRESINQALNSFWQQIEIWISDANLPSIIQIPDKLFDFFDENPDTARLIQQEVSNHCSEPDKLAHYWFENIFPAGEAMLEGIAGTKTGDPQTKQIMICCMAIINQIIGYYTLAPYVEKLGYACLTDDEAKAMQRKAIKNSIKGLLFIDL